MLAHACETWLLELNNKWFDRYYTMMYTCSITMITRVRSYSFIVSRILVKRKWYTYICTYIAGTIDSCHRFVRYSIKYKRDSSQTSSFWSIYIIGSKNKFFRENGLETFCKILITISVRNSSDHYPRVSSWSIPSTSHLPRQPVSILSIIFSY